MPEMKSVPPPPPPRQSPWSGSPPEMKSVSPPPPPTQHIEEEEIIPPIQVRINPERRKKEMISESELGNWFIIAGSITAYVFLMLFLNGYYVSACIALIVTWILFQLCDTSDSKK